MRAVLASVARTMGFPLRVTLLATLGLYRRFISPLVGGRCRFHPSCSEYAEGAIRTHGALKGSVLAGWRLLRCSPLSDGGVDRVPPRGRWRVPTYDSVIQEP